MNGILLLAILSFCCGAFANAVDKVDYWNNNDLEDADDGDLLLPYETDVEEEFNRRADPSVVEDARLLVVRLIINQIIGDSV